MSEEEIEFWIKSELLAPGLENWFYAMNYVSPYWGVIGGGMMAIAFMREENLWRVIFGGLAVLITAFPFLYEWIFPLIGEYVWSDEFSIKLNVTDNFLGWWLAGFSSVFVLIAFFIYVLDKKTGRVSVSSNLARSGLTDVRTVEKLLPKGGQKYDPRRYF